MGVFSRALVLGACVMAPLSLSAGVATAEGLTGEQIVATKCGVCHQKDASGLIPRIDEGRRTPEGWDMTVVRMMRNNGVDLTPEERTTVVQYLADTRGLSIAETESYRYILEKMPVAEDVGPTQEFTEMCSRCHSFARVGLQRRTKDDWRRLMNFHLGQFPTAEYQALARDRDWWRIASTDMVDQLAEMFPLGEAPAKIDPASLSGDWRLAGHWPGHGDYEGSMTATPKEGGDLSVSMTLSVAGKEPVTFEGTARVFGAGEWRASLSGEGGKIRQVLARSDDGSGLTGRWFMVDDDVVGAPLAAVKVGSGPALLAASPAYLKPGETTRVTLTGTDLSGDPDLGAGLEAKVVEASAGTVVLDVTAAADAAVGSRDISLGGAELPGSLVVYDALDRVAVEPAVTFARVGGNGGPIPKVPAQFEAIGYLNGPDGVPETEDDIRVGAMAATWRSEDFDETAAAMNDATFAGAISPMGLFTPGPAGPNPKRVKGTNNTGNLSIVATVADGGKTLEGSGQLYVTVQRFVDWPIR
ncbi:quinohemoprotein amine dehydrogenase subunit alpha [Rhodospirillum sp. A1_3_36]|uniref:quinohemoprotein amine dehydrogenase subunit alpha n=1 Tax=Rhodospirillum sp. A1_3_36 TaxID=3391666 RepID=UPI0039A65F67